MTEVLHSPSHLPSSPSSSSISCATPHTPPHNDGGSFHTQTRNKAQAQNRTNHPDSSPSSCIAENNDSAATVTDDDEDEVKEERDEDRRDQLSLLALLVTLFRKSLVACKTDREELCSMEIGWPTNVRHVAHVTFDRFNGFLGLPVEFEPEVPRRPPSASTNVFGVSTESMQLSYDSRGNSVPTILLLMQRHLYTQGGLQAEGIFRINAENSQEEFVRDQLNRGVVPQGIDVHCLAGLIKAWFRELPSGILDSLPPEQVMQSQSEEECAELVSHLPPTEGALLNWAINLMVDVVQQEHLNKMNARNIAMVFAPNMTQMADPLTALMYAVQVMNFLKTLIMKTLREREDSMVESDPAPHLEPSDENGHQSPLLSTKDTSHHESEEMDQPAFITKEPVLESPPDTNQNNKTNEEDTQQIPDSDGFYDSLAQLDTCINETEADRINGSKLEVQVNAPQNKISGPLEKTKGLSNLSRISSRTELIEVWR